MSAWTPIIEDISDYSVALSQLLQNSLNALRSQRASSRMTKEWHTSTKKAILEYDTEHNDEFVSRLPDLNSKVCTGMSLYSK